MMQRVGAFRRNLGSTEALGVGGGGGQSKGRSKRAIHSCSKWGDVDTFYEMEELEGCTCLVGNQKFCL